MNINNSYLQDDYEDQYLPFHIHEYVHPLDNNNKNKNNIIENIIHVHNTYTRRIDQNSEYHVDSNYESILHTKTDATPIQVHPRSSA